MPYFQIPRGKDFLIWPPFIAALAVIASALAISAARIVIREQEIRRERRTVEERIQTLEAERKRLEEAILALGSPEAVERVAKEKLNLKQPGEEVVVVVPEFKGPPAIYEFIPTWLAELIRFLLR